MERSRTRFRSSYLDVNSSLRVFLITVLLAGITGVYLRVQLSPEKIRQWGTEFTLPQPLTGKVVFKSAQIRLSEGVIPLFAIELREVRFFHSDRCQNTPGFTADKVLLPLRLRGLIWQELRLGTVTGENVSIDVDALKGDCDPQAESLKQARSDVTDPSVDRPMVSNGMGATNSGLKPSAIAPWWQEKDLVQLQYFLKGISFSKVIVDFEHRTKKLRLRDFAFYTKSGTGEISFRTWLDLPPELTYGEILPSLKIEARAKSTQAKVKVDADLSEGSLRGQATLSPGQLGVMEIEAGASVANVPLSEMVSVLVKSGIAREDFQPRFLWLNCRADIRGQVQGLFLNSPLEISACSVSGKGNSVLLPRAVRQPSGAWDPLVFQIAKLDVSSLLAAFNQKPPDGLNGDLGILTGDLEIRDKDDARFSGMVEGAEVQIGSGFQSAYQEIQKLRARFDIKGERISGSIDEIVMKDGEFQGQVAFDLNRRGVDGRLQAKIDKLSIAPFVQTKVLNGQFESLQGFLRAEIGKTAGEIKALEGELIAKNFEGQQVRAEQIVVQPQLSSNKETEFRFGSEKILIAQNVDWFAEVQPLFFDHRFEGSWIELTDFSLNARSLKDGGVILEKAQASLEGRKIRMEATVVEGSDKKLRGWVSLDFPKMKKLRWKVSGQRDQLKFEAESKSLIELNEKGVIRASRLGL